MLLRRLAGFYMPGGDLSSFEARYSFFFLSRLRGPYFGYFPFSFSLLFIILKFQDSFLGSGIQVHLAWTHFFKPGKVKTVGWFHQSSSFLKCLGLCPSLGPKAH